MIDVMELFDAEEKTSARTNVDSLNPAEGICFEIDRAVLKVLLERGIEIVPTKDMYPVLKNFQLRLRGNKLSVVSSNIEMSIIASTSMSVDVKSGGVDILPARQLLDIVRESDSASKIFIQVVGRRAYVVAGNASWELALAKGGDFPPMPKLSDAVMREASRTDFLRALSTVKYAASANRANLQAIQVRGGRFTACDGTRLQQVKIDNLMMDVLVPLKAVDILIKMLKGSDSETVQVGEVGTRLMFRIGSDVLLVNRAESNFPDLDQLWLRPALANDQELIVNRDALKSALKRVRLNADTDYGALAVYLHPATAEQAAEMVLFAVSDRGSAKEPVPIQWSGGRRELVVHYRYLYEALSHYQSESCLIVLGEDQASRKSPLVVHDKEASSIGIIQQMVNVPAKFLQTPDRR